MYLRSILVTVSPSYGLPYFLNVQLKKVVVYLRLDMNLPMVLWLFLISGLRKKSHAVFGIIRVYLLLIGIMRVVLLGNSMLS